MGNSCTRGGCRRDRSSSRSLPASLPTPAQAAAQWSLYWDQLYGPSDSAQPSPYHPLSSKPVQVPSLFDLCVEQLCVSMVGEEEIKRVVQKMQRRATRLAISGEGDTWEDDEEGDKAEEAEEEENGSVGAHSRSHSKEGNPHVHSPMRGRSPSTSTAAAVWAHAPSPARAHNGATRRYSHADVVAFSGRDARWMAGGEGRARYMYPNSNGTGTNGNPTNHGSVNGSRGSSTMVNFPISPFKFRFYPMTPPHRSTHMDTGPTLNRSCSLSISSKDSPELQPHQMAASSGSGSGSSSRLILGRSASTSGVTRVDTARNQVRDVNCHNGMTPPLHDHASASLPDSPFMLPSNAASYSLSPSANRAPVSPGAGCPPVQRVLHPSQQVASAPLYPASLSVCWSDPPSLSLPPPSCPTSTITIGPRGSGAHFVTSSGGVGEMAGKQLARPIDIATSTLLSAGEANGGYGESDYSQQSQRLLSHERQLRLPDFLIQLIFDRLIEEELLTSHNMHLFSNACLQSIDMTVGCGEPLEPPISSGSYTTSRYADELSDEWMHVLLAGVVQHYAALQTRMAKELEQKERTKMQMSKTLLLNTDATPMTQRMKQGLDEHAREVIHSPMHIDNATSTPNMNTRCSSETVASAASSTVLMPGDSRSPSSLLSLSPPLAHNSNTISPQSVFHTPSSSSSTSSAALDHADMPPPWTGTPLADTPHHHLTNASGALSTTLLASMQAENRGVSSTPRVTARNNYSDRDSMSPPAPEPVSMPDPRLPGTPMPSTPVGSNGTNQPASYASVCPSPLPTLHNPLSFTSPSPSLTLYAHAPSLTALNLSGCARVTHRSLQPLQLCLKLRSLVLNGCTQIGDEFLMCVLQNKFILEELQLKGCRSVTDETLSVLGDKRNLKVLQLDCCRITDRGLLQLAALTKLEQLSVGWCGSKVTHQGLAWITNNPALRSLCIAFTGIQSIDFLSNLHSLHEINLSGLKMTEPDLRPGAHFPHLHHVYIQRSRLREIPSSLLTFNLHTLDISFSNNIASGKLLYQIQHWPHSKPTQVTSRNNNCCSGGSVPTSPSLSAHGIADMHTIQLSGLEGDMQLDTVTPQSLSHSSSWQGTNDLHASPPSITSIASASSSPVPSPFSSSHASLPHPVSSESSFPRLRVLNVEGCNMDNRIARAIASSFSHLTSLNLTDTDVGPDGLNSLAALVALRVLHLSGTKANNTTLAHLAPKLQRLRDLYFDCPSVSDAGLASLPLLASTLRRLDLFQANLSDTAITHITTLRHLTTLELCSGRITNAGVASIARHNTALISLNLSQNKSINDEAVVSLRNLTRLQHLNLSGTSVTCKALSALVPPEWSHGTSNGPIRIQDGGSIGGAIICSSLRHLSLFGCAIKPTAAKAKDLPPGIHIALDAGIVSVEEDATS